MKPIVVFFTILLSGIITYPQDSEMPPDLQVVKYSWSKERIDWENPFGAPVEGFNEMLGRVRTERRPTSALEERSIRAAKEEQKKPSKPPRYYFNYKFFVLNGSTKTIKEIDWDYIFIDAVTGEQVGRREFTSVEKIGPGKRKELSVKISAPPTERVSVYSLGKNEREGVVEKIIVLRVLYDDDSVWVVPTPYQPR